MGKRIVIIAGLVFLLSSYAQAGQSGDYIGVSAGVLLLKSSLTDREGSHADVSYNNLGIPVSVFAGRQFDSGLRIEEEIFYKNATAHELHYSGLSSTINSTIWSIGAMSNLYYDFFRNVEALSNGPYSPYIGIGIGFANVNMSAGTDSRFKLWNGDSDTVFAYQAAIGSGIPIRKDITLDVSYRFFGTTSVAVDQIKTDYNNHNFLLGVRYLFR